MKVKKASKDYLLFKFLLLLNSYFIVCFVMFLYSLFIASPLMFYGIVACCCDFVGIYKVQSKRSCNQFNRDYQRGRRWELCYAEVYTNPGEGLLAMGDHAVAIFYLWRALFMSLFVHIVTF